MSKDKSAKIPQGPKIKEAFEIKLPFELTEKQKQLINIILDKNTKVVFINAPAGTGKAQPLDSKILTPNGWVFMKDIKIGDKIFAANGDICNVTGVFPQGEKEIYEVIFSDGAKTRCCDEHLWQTQNYDERNHTKKKELPKVDGKRKRINFSDPLPPKIRTLKEIRDNLTVSGKHGTKANHSIDLVSPLNFPEVKHYIHPYALGVLLGDGCFRNSISFTSADLEIVQKMERLCPESLKLVPGSNNISYFFRKKINSCKPPENKNQYIEEIKKLGLFGLFSNDKFIPDEYLFDSLSNRIELLRGLMDTDGSTNGHYHYYCTTSKLLAEGITSLVRSLGGTAMISEPKQTSFVYKNEKKRGLDAYHISIKLPNEINPFFLSRKANKVIPYTKYHPTRYFKQVNYLGKELAQCISIDHSSRLYVTDDFIVTHNTYVGLYAGLQMLRDKKVAKISYVRTAVEASKSVGFLPGELNDKINPYTRPLADKLDEFLYKATTDKLLKDGFVTADLVNFLRGASINVEYVFVDESQNFNKSELITTLTRLGKHSKFIFAGDTMQSDIGGKSGFADIFNLFDDEESKSHGIHTFTFDKNDILRSEELKYIIDKLQRPSNTFPNQV